MRHRKMLISSVIIIAVGIVLWFIVGPITMLFGIGTGSYETTSWWGLVRETHYYEYATSVYYVGLGLTLFGIILVIAGAVLIVITVILEFTKSKPKEQLAVPTVPQPPQ
jgi:ABC-type Fe3+ transport system permease subunit